MATRAAAALAAAFVALHSVPVAAQSVAPFHWGFSPAFGRGRYELDDGTEAQIYRVIVKPPIRRPPGDEDRDASKRGPGIRLVLPVTAALLDTPDEQLPPGRSTDHVEAYSFLPGVELEFAPTERFTLRTNAQAGWGKELEGDERSARLAALGVRGRLKFGDAPGRPALIGGALWAGVDPSEAQRQALLRLTAALEFDVGVPRWQVRGHSMRLLPHVLVDDYRRVSSAASFANGGGDGGAGSGADDGEGAAAGDAASAGTVPRDRGSETQIGVAAGRDEPFKIWFFKF
ncbi:MAG TPA: hypothetical protein VFO94_18940, partial [Gammaproteobacteria bacterium]|nr:hypothetical protein [Gammaproteobacteria bacterium]